MKNSENALFLIIIIAALGYFFCCIQNDIFCIAHKKTSHSWQKQTKKGYRYYDERKLPYKQKIILFAYGSLVKQKENRKTGDFLEAGLFEKTSLQVPVSFTFLAGYPVNGYFLPLDKLKNFSNRRVTVTIDSYANEYKDLWFAISKFNSLSNARNNLAAREGAPFKGIHKGYDLTNIFYIKKLLPYEHKKSYEEFVDEFSQWVTLKPHNKQQQLTDAVLKKMVLFAQENGAQAAIWVALPSNVDRRTVNELIKNDPVFVKNTKEYIEKIPNSSILTGFEKNIFKQAAIIHQN